jgi:hypothetical protein
MTVFTVNARIRRHQSWDEKYLHTKKLSKEWNNFVHQHFGQWTPRIVQLTKYPFVWWITRALTPSRVRDFSPCATQSLSQDVNSEKHEADRLLRPTTKAKNKVSVPIATNNKTTVFLNVMSYSIVNVYHCIKGIIFKYNQQDATLYNILYHCQCSACFRLFLRPSSGAQNCTHSIRYMSSLLLPLALVSFQPDAVCTVLGSWWWAEKPPETYRALTVIKNTV